MPSTTHTLAKKVTEITIKDMPKEAIDMTKTVFLDSVGCALGAYAIDKGKIMNEFIRESGGSPQASVIGGGLTSFAQAALANGDLMNALDFDMVSIMAGHAVPYVIPAGLAMAERVHASGEKLLEALTLGLEVADRIQSSVAQHYVKINEPPYHKENDRFSYALPLFGGVAAAGKIIGLDAGKLAHAFGIAGASMPVPASQKWEHNEVPGIMLKYNCWSGWISHLATVAVLLAEKGFTADDTILDGEWGLWKIVASPHFREDIVLKGLGQEWHTKEQGIKPYPCCRANTSGIEAIIDLVEENKINPDDIKKIVVKGPPPLLFANRLGTTIRSGMDTQFVDTYLFAVACYLGKQPGPGWHQPQTFNDPKIRALMEKVEVAAHPKTAEYVAERIKKGGIPLFGDTIVEIQVDGRTFSKEIKNLKGSVPNLLTEAELEAKFRANAAYSPLSEQKTTQGISAIGKLEKIKDITQVTAILRTE